MLLALSSSQINFKQNDCKKEEKVSETLENCPRFDIPVTKDVAHVNIGQKNYKVSLDDSLLSTARKQASQ